MKLSALLFFVLAGRLAFACSCIGESTVKDAYKSSDFVFSGQVISTAEEWLPDSAAIREYTELGISTDKLDKMLTGQVVTKVLVQVERIYKGKSSSDTITIYTGTGGGDCGYHFEAGKRYIIYGDEESYFGSFSQEKNSGQQNLYWTNICTRTQTHNPDEIRELEKIKR